MKLKDIIKILNAKVLVNNCDKELDIQMACGSDLMSDVLSFIKPGALLLTGLVTEQVIFTAEIADISVICFVRGKIPGGEIIRLSQEKGISLIVTNLPMFESCGLLYRAGLKGCSEVSSDTKINLTC